jgi:hypothetical protein
MRILKFELDIDKEIKELSKGGFSSEAQILSLLKRYGTVEITDEEIEEYIETHIIWDSEAIGFRLAIEYIKSRINQ